MDQTKHKESFDCAYREKQFLMNYISFPLAEMEKFEWQRGKWGSEYYSYYYKRFTSHILSRLQIDEGNKILVIGCGAGGDEKNLRSLYPNLKITSIDISEEMIKKAVANLSPSNFMVCLAEDLPFQNNCFDRILSREVIEHVLDPQKMLFEVARVLKPNGIAVITTENEESFSPKNYYDIKIKSKLANMLEVPIFQKNYKDEAPKLSEIKAYGKNTGLVLEEHFWDGALYKSLLRIWKKRLKKFFKFPVSSWAHWFSCLENNRTLAYWFCDQAKYVFKKPEKFINLDLRKEYVCTRCNSKLQPISDEEQRCVRCDQVYSIVEGLLYLKYDERNQKSYKTEEGLRGGKVKQFIYKVLNNTLSAIYNILYFSSALIFSFFAKKNNKQLSHLMAPNDAFQKYLKKN
jgi:2-polyprenyl-3-methyl-5-hydroxy-6-metoxy-1,4-benzoquinol methylase